ncbi:hypothetical protein QTG54_007267 [Skeletonema marinoi]|uniref:Suppressor of forked domain-containing protein n=1 Tax=Skeletonema marinoi TaxID=267567 RepID=A0AAD8Y9U0_9STRA|nr:hypothetical protein QTG54_007267 [Skeletonema marinoi]|mmetsp:Transcript_7091/g.11851  ORF Transcript_7091/g.11851 Transcript_7091/m.11851 type:complete len:532 (-) Transcript_7091:38-1633(-)
MEPVLSSSAPPQYNSQSIINTAEETLQTSGVSAAQTVYKSALLEWVDDVTMGDTIDKESVKGEIANLWLAYADLNRRSNLFKSATEVYEQAINCPVGGEVGKIWMEYVHFLEERGRPRTAQKLYLRALVEGNDGDGPSVKDVADQNLLWNEFLRMMQSLRKNPDLTLEDLKSAVEHERGAQVDISTTIMQPEAVASAADSSASNTAEQRPAKRSRWDKKTPEQIETLSAGSIDTAASVVFATSKNMPPEVETLWHARDGGSMPCKPEPALFSASPPKLGDPSGKDLVGIETAVKLLQMLTSKTHDGKSLGSALLELCHACWMMTALKEEEAVKANEALEKKITTDTEALESNLAARASVAGGAMAAVQHANEQERNQFIMQCTVQREQLLAFSAWEFRKLLYTQQIILSSAKLPYFDGPSVDSASINVQAKVCSILHSAFYLRARVGEENHVKMLTKQLENLQKIASTVVKSEPVQQQHPAQLQMQLQQHQQLPYQQPPPNFPLPPPMPPQMFQHPQQGQQMTGYYGQQMH